MLRVCTGMARVKGVNCVRMVARRYSAAFQKEKDADSTSAMKTIHDIQMLLGNKIGTIMKVPKICVIGGQSAGKSSVVEAIIGMDILPKGSGMVTRHPTSLSLIRSEKGSPFYAQFDGTHEKIYNIDVVRNRLIEFNQGELSPEPIMLTLYSPFFYNLMLVDLPGLIQVAGRSQARELPDMIKKMCRPYIEDNKYIKLVVASATEDLATAVGIKEIRKAKQEHNAFYVITKTDMVTNRVELLKILGDNEYTDGLGVIGVKLRSQADLDAGKSLEDVIKMEEEQFKKLDMPGGVPLLRQELAREQLSRATGEIPQIIGAVEKYLTQTEADKSLLEQLATNSDLDKIAKNVEKLVTEIHPNSASRVIFERLLYNSLRELVTSRINAAIAATHGKTIDMVLEGVVQPQEKKGARTTNTMAIMRSWLNSGDKTAKPDVTAAITDTSMRDFLIYGKGTAKQYDDDDLTQMSHNLVDVSARSAFYKFVIPDDYNARRYQFMENVENVIHLITTHPATQAAAGEEPPSRIDFSKYNISETSRKLCLDQIMSFVKNTTEEYSAKRGENAELTIKYFEYILNNIAQQTDKLLLSSHTRTVIYAEKRSTSSFHDIAREIINTFRYDATRGPGDGSIGSLFSAEKFPVVVPVFGNAWQKAEYQLLIDRVANKLFAIYATEMVDPLVFLLIRDSFKFFSEKNISQDASKKVDEVAKLNEILGNLRKIHDTYTPRQKTPARNLVVS